MSSLDLLKEWLQKNPNRSDSPLLRFRLPWPLIPVSVEVHRKGKTYRAIRWKKPPEFLEYSLEDFEKMPKEEFHRARKELNSLMESSVEQSNSLQLIAFKARQIDFKLSIKALEATSVEESNAIGEVLARVRNLMGQYSTKMTEMAVTHERLSSAKRLMKEAAIGRIPFRINPKMPDKSKVSKRMQIHPHHLPRLEDIPIKDPDNSDGGKYIRSTMKLLPREHLRDIKVIETKMPLVFKKGLGFMDGDGSGVNVDDKIYLSWAKVSFFFHWEQGARKLVLHEIAHSVARTAFGEDYIEEESTFVDQWFKGEGEFGKERHEGRYMGPRSLAEEISEDRNYAATSSSEAFAEAYACYVLKPEALEKISPLLYQKIKEEIFGGIEYKEMEEHIEKSLIPRSILILKEWLENAEEGEVEVKKPLVPTTVDVHRGDKTYRAIRWKRLPDYSSKLERLTSMPLEELSEFKQKIQQEKSNTINFMNRLQGLRYRAERLLSNAEKDENLEAVEYYEKYKDELYDQMDKTLDFHVELHQTYKRIEEEERRQGIRRKLPELLHSDTAFSGLKYSEPVDPKDVEVIGGSGSEKRQKTLKEKVNKVLMMLPKEHLGTVTHISLNIPIMMRQLWKMKEGDGGGLCDSSNRIYLNWGLFESNPEWTGYSENLVAHEIGHAVYRTITSQEDGKLEWRHFTDWFKREQDGEVKSIAEAVSHDGEYATTDPAEAFAEIYQGFIYKPQKLKESSNWAYEWVRDKVFGGFSYDD